MFNVTFASPIALPATVPSAGAASAGEGEFGALLADAAAEVASAAGAAIAGRQDLAGAGKPALPVTLAAPEPEPAPDPQPPILANPLLATIALRAPATARPASADGRLPAPGNSEADATAADAAPPSDELAEDADQDTPLLAIALPSIAVPPPLPEPVPPAGGAPLLLKPAPTPAGTAAPAPGASAAPEGAPAAPALSPVADAAPSSPAAAAPPSGQAALAGLKGVEAIVVAPAGGRAVGPRAQTEAADAPAKPPVPAPAPLIGVAQPAARAFAAAIAAIAAKPARLRDEHAAEPATLAAPATALADRAAPADARPLDLRREDWPQRLIDRIDAAREAADAGSTRIRLVPDALGRIDVALRRDGDTLHVHFTAEQPATRDLLAAAQPKLAELADARGLKLGGSGAQTAGDPAAGGQARHGLAQQITQNGRGVNAPASGSSAEASVDPDGRIA